MAVLQRGRVFRGRGFTQVGSAINVIGWRPLGNDVRYSVSGAGAPGGTAMTFCCAAKMPETFSGNTPWLCSLGGTGAGVGFYYSHSAGEWTPRYFLRDGSGLRLGAFVAAQPGNAFYTMGLSYTSGATNGLRIFLNGTLRSTFTWTGYTAPSPVLNQIGHPSTDGPVSVALIGMGAHSSYAASDAEHLAWHTACTLDSVGFADLPASTGFDFAWRGASLPAVGDPWPSFKGSASLLRSGASASEIVGLGPWP